MTVFDLLEKYNMKPHEENGSYAECHFRYDKEGRAPSGSSYFYVPAGEKTLFHRIDCDEYWCFNAGDALEVWIVNVNGTLEIKRLGLDKDCEQLLYFPRGVIFASRSLNKDGDGTFFTCITVPRFSYDGFELLEREEVTRICPETEEFYFSQKCSHR